MTRLKLQTRLELHYCATNTENWRAFVILYYCATNTEYGRFLSEIVLLCDQREKLAYPFLGGLIYTIVRPAQKTGVFI